jgi:transcriptional regulator with XRE-family HTH domain
MGRGIQPTKFKSEFAERLKAARIASGYATQQEFATAMGVPIERYKKWESGRTPMPHQYIPAACELTGQDANYFFKVAPRAAPFRKTA